MSLLASISTIPLSLSVSTPHPPPRTRSRRFSPPLASLSSSASPEQASSSSPPESFISSNPSSKPFVESPKAPDKSFNYVLASPNGNPVVRLVQSTESSIERASSICVLTSICFRMIVFNFFFFHIVALQI
ncbi:hypothetical protein Acr_15g0012720 [Actinidia rufa]|uniref:Uncharacterized protein n=1 Tax=Actinidia rufa TaxID=165716 RepID=A0A7J0FVQ8_9ERIC|nr:hypothetical protein Acr_15g0012720 [Actinidia rufa]